MASEREDNKALADRLRGKAANDVREAGKELSAQVSKVQTVKEISGPTATPKMTQEQSAPLRERHVTEKQQQNQVGPPAGGQAQQQPAQSAPDKPVSKDLAEAAQKLRQTGVVSGRAGNDVARPKQTPAVAQKPTRGRGR